MADPAADIPFLQTLFARAARTPKRIILPEGEDSRVQHAACTAARMGLAQPILLGRVERIAAALPDPDTTVTIQDPGTCPHLPAYAALYRERRKADGPSHNDAFEAVTAPLGHAAMAVHSGDADGMLGGAIHTTAETLRTALQIIGPAPGVTTVSSFFLMLAVDDANPLRAASLFADCALNINPDSDDLASIGLSTAQSARIFLAEEPLVAFLSFSTAGSSRHPAVDTVHAAARHLQQRAPALRVLGEIQFDAAIDPTIGQRKAPDGTFPGLPNVFIFPNLDAGNISYKIAERLGRMMAIGPVLQGLARPANDLSRGCSASDILAMIAITSLQAGLSFQSVDGWTGSEAP